MRFRPAHLSWRTLALTLGAFVAAGTLSAVALLMLLTTRWDAPVLSRQPEALFSAGPFRSGDSFEQRFVVPVDYLSRLRIAVRRDGGDAAANPTELIFRLSDGGQIVRQGVVNVAELGPEIQWVRWEFAPLVDSAGRDLRLQVVVGDDTAQPIFAMASLTDQLPGSLISNGVPTGDHIDLALAPGRALYPSQILAVLGARFPGGVPGIAFAGLLVGVTFGAGLLRMRGARRPLPKRLGWGGLGIALAALAAVLILRSVAKDVAAETDLTLWLRLGVWGIGLAVGPWLLVAMARAPLVVPGRLKAAARRPAQRTSGWVVDSIQTWLLPRAARAALRFGLIAHRLGWRLPAVAAAALLTLAALVGLVLTDAEPLLITLQVLEAGRPPAGRLPTLSREFVMSISRAALFAWLAFGGLTLLIPVWDRVRRPSQ